MLKKLGVLAAAAVLCAAAVRGWLAPMAREAQQATRSGEPASSLSEVLYRLGTAEGYVAVYDAQTNALVTVLDTPLRALPAEERIRLTDGIPVYSEAELQQLMEDFS